MMLYKPQFVILLPLAPVASHAQELEVAWITAAAHRGGNDVVNFELRPGFTAGGTSVVLPDADSVNVGWGEHSAVGSLSGSVLVTGDHRFAPEPFWVTCLHALVDGANHLRVVLHPFDGRFAMAGGVFNSAFSGPSGPKTRVAGVVFSLPHLAAPNADTVRNEPQIVPVPARNTSGIVDSASLASSDAIRMLWSPLQAGQCVLDCAYRAYASARVALGNMAVTARLSSPVESFSSRLGSHSFGNRLSHWFNPCPINYVDCIAAS